MEPLSTYKERSPFLRRTIQLFADKVIIDGYHFQSGSFRAVVDLATVSPDYGYIHFNRADRFVGLWLLIPLAAIFYVMKIEFQLPISHPQCITTLVLGTLAALFSFVQMCRKILVYRFSNKENLIVLDVFKSGPDANRCLEFVKKIQKAIIDHSS